MDFLRRKLGGLKRNEVSGLAFSAAVGVYLIVALLFALITMKYTAEQRAEASYFYVSFFLPVPVVLLSLIFIFGFSPYGAHDYLKFGFKPKNLLPVILIFAGAFFSLNKINDVVIALLEKVGYKEPTTTLPAFSVFDYIGCIVIVCVLPALFEEALFRGVILGGIKGGAASVVVSAALFSLYHMSPAKTAYQLVMGCVFAVVAIKTDSLMPSAIIHFLNNFAIVTFNYFAPDAFSDKPFVLCSTISGAVVLAVGFALLFVFNKENKIIVKTEENADNGRIGRFLLFAAVGIFGAAVVWIAGLVG